MTVTGKAQDHLMREGTIASLGRAEDPDAAGGDGGIRTLGTALHRTTV